jgi:hypothetical protein
MTNEHMSGFDESLSDVLRIMKGTPDIDIPLDLIRGVEGPFARSHLDSVSTVWVNEIASQMFREISYHDPDVEDFSGKAQSGYMVVGVFSLGGGVRVDTPECLIHVHSGGAELFLRIAYNSTDNGSFTGHINEYLRDLSQFLQICRSRNLQVEVVEYSSFSRYRVVDKKYRSVEKKINLVENPDRIEELNQLITEAALLNDGLDIPPEQFLAADDAFQTWQRDNQRGSVMVLTPSLMPNRPIIHSPGCPTMVEEQLPENKVVCASDMPELLAWADDQQLAVPGLCSRCFFLGIDS